MPGKKAIFFCIPLFGMIAFFMLAGLCTASAQDSLHHDTTTDSAGVQKKGIPAKDSTMLGQDTTVHTKDTGTLVNAKTNGISLDSLRKRHSPRRAAFYSAVLPGLGQVYNHQYIKVPLMLGGMGVATGIFLFNFNKYITYRNAYRLRLNGHLTGDPRVDIYTPSDLQFLSAGYRQNVDYSVLGFAAVYLYNILDAIVFAHLYHFDISNDLSKIKFGPVINTMNYNTGYASTITGLGFTYQF